MFLAERDEKSDALYVIFWLSLSALYLPLDFSITLHFTGLQISW